MQELPKIYACSAEEHAEGYGNWFTKQELAKDLGKEIVIRLDGNPQTKVLIADEINGRLVRWQTDHQTGNVILNDVGDEVLREELFGVVQVDMIDIERKAFVI